MRLLLAVLLIWPSAQLMAATLVVAQRDARARDTNNGSDDAPLLTLSAAAQRVRAGDRVLVHAGEYRETLIVTASGTEASPIIFEAARGETVVIKGSDVLHNWEHDDGAVCHAKLPPKPVVRG